MEKDHRESLRSDEEGTGKSNDAGPERADKHKQYCAEGKRQSTTEKTPGAPWQADGI